MQFEFWGDDEHNPIIEDDFNEDIIYSEDDELNEKCKDSDNIYSDEQGFKYSLVSIKDKTRYKLLCLILCKLLLFNI